MGLAAEVKGSAVREPNAGDLVLAYASLKNEVRKPTTQQTCAVLYTYQMHPPQP